MNAKLAGSSRPKHVPRRTCVTCRQGSAKRELVRIVRTAAGAVVIDPGGKVSGRGAYLCRSRACWDAALHKKTIERALRVAIGPDERTVLEQFAAGLAG